MIPESLNAEDWQEERRRVYIRTILEKNQNTITCVKKIKNKKRLTKQEPGQIAVKSQDL
jgi:hypothetical protein